MFQFFSKNYLGVDIGTSSIRFVEVTKNKRLENYGEISFADFDKPFIYAQKSQLVLAEDNVAQALSALLAESKVRTKEVFFSLADFASFFTTFEIPAMKNDQLSSAIQFEAKKYIPIDIDNVILDWQVIEKGQERYKVLVIAITKDIVEQYKRIALKCGLQVQGLEAEVFSLSRALLKNKKTTACLIDLGIKSSTVSIVENGVIKDSHSLNFSGAGLTSKAMTDLHMSVNDIEKLKIEKGLKEGSELIQPMMPMVNTLFSEVSRLIKYYQQRTGRNIEKIILAGGMSLMPGFIDLVRRQFNVVNGIDLADAFSSLTYPEDLEDNLKKLSPQFAIAVGLALKEVYK